MTFFLSFYQLFLTHSALHYRIFTRARASQSSSRRRWIVSGYVVIASIDSRKVTTFSVVPLTPRFSRTARGSSSEGERTMLKYRLFETFVEIVRLSAETSPCRRAKEIISYTHWCVTYVSVIRVVRCGVTAGIWRRRGAEGGEKKKILGTFSRHRRKVIVPIYGLAASLAVWWIRNSVRPTAVFGLYYSVYIFTQQL